jgi:trimeric autotransporter adhesin
MKPRLVLKTTRPLRHTPFTLQKVLGCLLLLTVLFPIDVVAQGVLTNGGNASGSITASVTSNSWTFTANAGQNIALRLGSSGFQGKLQLFSPTAALLSTAGGNSPDWPLNYTATSTGTYTVVVSSFYAGGTGSYVLHFLQLPGSFVVPTGDDGGAMTNGGNHAGTLTVGDLDPWTFSANAGDNITLRLGSAGFHGNLVLYGPDGSQLKTAGGNNDDWSLGYTATSPGTYTVVVSSFYQGETGAYTLHFLQIPGAFIVPPGDEGGALTNGASHAGTITVGDLDPWTFTASAGDNIALRLGSSGFHGNLVLYGPDGASLKTAGGNNVDWSINYLATNSGTFTVVVSTFYQGETGSYGLSYIKIPGLISVPPGGDGGAMTNGGNHAGTLAVGDLDPWTFSASAGDNIALRLGSSGFQGNLVLYGPDGAQLKTSGGNNDDWSINYMATNNGTFLVLVSSYYQGGTGSYTLSYVKVPGAFVVPTGDDGGAMTNGGNHAGTLTVGDLDPWTFNANAGENVVLRLGSAGFQGNLMLYGPDGALLKTSGGNNDDWSISFMPTNSGTFTVVVGSYYQGTVGSYVLHYVKFPGAFIVPPGDTGGGMTGAGSYLGTLDLGDLEVWAFTACKGDPISLRLNSTNFQGSMSLYGPDGALLKTVGGNNNVWTLNYGATNCGRFEVVVSSYYAGGTGTYGLTANGLSDILRICIPSIAGNNMVLSGAGGPTGATFIVLQSTNVEAPLASWTPLWTNQFDAYGTFGHTNAYHPNVPQQFFRYRVP